MANGLLLSPGPPLLTQVAADCAIDLVDFMAAVVRGVDTIDVTPAVREAWRAHLAAYYPMLSPADRYWFASAPITLSTVQATWEQLPPVQQDMYRQTWASAIPGLLQLVGPALTAAPASGSVADLVSARLAEQQAQAQQATQAGNAAQEELARHNVNTAMLSNWSTTMANNTINLMHAMSGRP